MQFFQLDLSNYTKHTPPVFATFVQSLLLLLLLFSSFQSFAKEISYADQCDQEANKESINKSHLKDVCLKAAKQKEADKNNDEAFKYYKAEQYQIALNLFKKALDIREQILGKTHPVTAISYNNIGFTYGALGNHNKALEYQLKALAIQEKVPGKEHPDIAASYNNIGFIYGSLGNHSKALEYKLKALGIREKVLGNEHPDTAASYNNIGSAYGALGNHTKALEYQLKALTIRKKVLGKAHPVTAASYNNVGLTYEGLGNHSKALEYQLKALGILEKVQGKAHPNIARSYNNLGAIYGVLGNRSKALEYQLKALGILEKVLGKAHPDTAISYDNVGFTYGALGNHTKALEYQLKALVLFEKVLGEGHPETAVNYSFIGATYGDLGNHSKALEYQLKALGIRKKVLGKGHPATASSYDYLGVAYRDLGNHSKALEYQLKALAILEKVLGKAHPNTAASYNNIGASYGDLGNYSKALEYQLIALAIQEKVLGKAHPHTATTYSNIGLTYRDLSNHSKALEYQLKALSIREKVLGKEHPNTAASYNNIGLTYRDLVNHSKALEYQLKALGVQEKVLGEAHPDTANSYNNIGATYGELGNHRKAYQYAKKAFTTFLLNRNNNFSALNTQQKKQFLKANERYINYLLSYSTHYLNLLTKQDKTQQALTQKQTTTNDWLAYKGSVLEAENRLMLFAKTAKSLELKKQYQVYIEAKQYFSQLNQNIPDSKVKITAWKKQLKTQEDKISALEQTIKKADPRFKDKKNLQAINTNDIAQGLTKDSLYIDFAKTNDGYYLFTIDYKNTISFTAYSEDDSKAIDAQIKSFQEDIQIFVVTKNMSVELMNKLNKSSKQSLAKLYKRIFNKTLLAKISDKKSLIISPDGALRLLPFEALYDAEKEGGGEYLIESKNIRYIASGKELVRLARQNKGKTNTNKAVIFANPDFGGKPSKETQENRSQIYIPNTDATKTMGTLSLSPNFKALKGTKDEADAIVKVLTLKEILHDYRGNDANEANLLEVKHPTILHIATHGFFLKDIPNPMLKSGLILAGANLSLEANKGDGIVTALDLSGLELQGTDLVVLSACETGKVDPNNTDGISGLTKAFIQAGAKNVVMSLWSVADKETAELMTAFYKAGKGDKQYAKALKESKLALLDKGMHPFYWAAFVLSGGN